MAGTLLHVFGSRERHSEPTQTFFHVFGLCECHSEPTQTFLHVFGSCECHSEPTQTLLHVFGPCECHSEPTQTLIHVLVHVNVILNLHKLFSTCLVHVNVILNLHKRCASLPDRYQRQTVSVDVCINRATNRNWQTKLFDGRKGIQVNVLRHERINVPATRWCISGMELPRQLYVLPHRERSCRSNMLPHSVTTYRYLT